MAALLALALVVLKGATQVGWVATNATLEFWIIAGAGAVVFVQSIRGGVQLYRLPRREHRQKQLEKAVLASLKSIGQITLLDLTALGGSLFVLPRHRWLWKRRHLTRRIRYRLNEYPQGSGIFWTEGKGAVGQAVRDLAPRHFDWRQVAATWNEPGIVPAEAYDALSKADRMGFSYDEFRKIAPKYAEGLAVPILSEDSERILGVFAVDVPYAPELKDQPCRLDSPQVIQIATACAGVLRDILDES
ncbi:hypothetical protein [Arthrobacter sp. A5]|uniref:hypothetical protein n=1 Tax=Arthrobacter sp. A5 TaxID=576926 RepID=UPI003DA7AE6F